jgi:magnesium chelatase family protein
VLFLDELPEFKRAALESLRQPVEEGFITISRSLSAVVFPARFQLIAAMNPCPCGFLGHPSRECRCTPVQIARYRSRVSGPLLDRIDLHVWVDPVDASSILSPGHSSTSARIREIIGSARSLQLERGYLNGAIPDGVMEKTCGIDARGKGLLIQAMRSCHLSMRGFKRVIKVARTVADLEGSLSIRHEHLAEALQYRPDSNTLPLAV